MNRQSGKVHIITILGALCGLMIVGLLFFSRESPQTVAGAFMGALGRGDVDTLVKLSYAPDRDKDELRSQWEFAVKEAGPYFRFTYDIKGVKEADDKTAAVRMIYWPNVDDPASYEQNYDLPMVKEDGKWKVDVLSITSKMYPALPR